MLSNIRSTDEVARRCIVLYAVIGAGYKEPRHDLVAWLRSEGLWDYVSPQESGFLLAESPTYSQFINATWRTEALFPLLWSIGLLAELPSPQQLCDVPMMQSVLPPLLGSVGRFISTATLRDEAKIHDANEEIFQIHWRVRDSQLRTEPPLPGALQRIPIADCESPAETYNAAVVQERHHALNWLIGYFGQDWDDITTDT